MFSGIIIYSNRFFFIISFKVFRSQLPKNNIYWPENESSLDGPTKKKLSGIINIRLNYVIYK
jgi:hypothetical protein